MKHNPKETINIIMLVEEFIVRLNRQCVEHKVQKHYSIGIVKGVNPKAYKTLKFTVANLDTKERLTLFELDYTVKNPADALSAPYKRTLYREFLYNSVGVLAFNIEQNIIHNKTKKVLSSQETFDPNKVEHPVNPADAFAPNIQHIKRQ